MITPIAFIDPSETPTTTTTTTAGETTTTTTDGTSGCNFQLRSSTFATFGVLAGACAYMLFY